jgi:hypothetical protein
MTKELLTSQDDSRSYVSTASPSPASHHSISSHLHHSGRVSCCLLSPSLSFLVCCSESEGAARSRSLYLQRGLPGSMNQSKNFHCTNRHQFSWKYQVFVVVQSIRSPSTTPRYRVTIQSSQSSESKWAALKIVVNERMSNPGSHPSVVWKLFSSTCPLAPAHTALKSTHHHST